MTTANPLDHTEAYVVRLKNWPLRDHWPLCLVVLTMIAAGLLLAMQAGRWLEGLLATTVMLVTVWRMWVPVNYLLDDVGVHASVLHFRRSYPWRSFRGYLVEGDVIRLIPATNWFASFRSVPVDANQQLEEVKPLLARHLELLDTNE